MSFVAGIGKGKEKDPFEAGRNAARDALVMLQNKEPEALLLFLSSTCDAKKFSEGIRSIFPTAPLVGCTTAGHFTADELFDDGGILLALSSDRGALFATGVGTGMHASEREAGKAMAQSIQAKIPGKKLSLLLAFSDGLAGSGMTLLRGISEQIGPGFPIAGAFAGDRLEFKKTGQYEGLSAYTDAVVGLGISGAPIGIAGEHGWKTIGIPMVATKTEGALLVELDHHPAFALYEKYFGDMAREFQDEPMSRLSLTYPLGLRVGQGDVVLLRTPLSIDDDGGILCGSEIPEGSQVRLLLGSKDTMLAAASKAAHRAKSALLGKAPKAALVMSSMTRRKLLGGDAMKEIHAVRDALGPRVPIVGFYGYGEFVPLSEQIPDFPRSVFQNESIVVCLIGDC